jgi:site-specific DNA-methyltransferase (adenine-specific)
MAAKLNRIIQGDCIEVMEKQIEPGSIDLVFADPPFNIGYQYDQYDDRQPDERYLRWSARWMSLVHRVLKPTGTFWLAIGDEYAAELKVIATRELGFFCRSWVVWYYTFGVHCERKFTRSHAHLFYFVKGEPDRKGRLAEPKGIIFNTDDIRVPSARQLVYADRRANPKGRVPDDTWIIAPPAHQNRDRQGGVNSSAGTRLPISNSQLPIEGQGPEAHHEAGVRIDNRQSTIDNQFVLRPQDLRNGFPADGDVWYFPRVCGTFKERQGFHGCQMPEQLLGRIIRACSNDGELVFDPFSGSGTTLAVARKLGRKYLGIELSPQYVSESRTRLESIRSGQALVGADDPLTSVPDTANGKIRGTDGRRRRRRTAGNDSYAKTPTAQPFLWT